MPIDVDSGLAAFARGLEMIPRIIIAPVLLAGPTILWLLYRFLVRPGTFRQRPDGSQLAVWACASCASLTPVDQLLCYRCRAERPPGVIELEPDGAVREAPPTMPPTAPHTVDSYVGVPVGPGRPEPPRASTSPIVFTPSPPSSPSPRPTTPARSGPVISPPSRMRVSGKSPARSTTGTAPSPSPTSPNNAAPATTRTRRRRSGQS
jgi:hypothetical protein